ncbi:MAG: DNA polymerase IV [Aliidongia sp.]
MTETGSAIWLCRDCGRLDDAGGGESCVACGSSRVLEHRELSALAIAHVDCDAFYASVEKRDRPELADEPVVIGGRQRGVVATCCYVARRYGVRSAMPMGRALALCPHATVIRPDMEKYKQVSLQIRQLMQAAARLVEPVSIDEAYLEMSGLDRSEPAARGLARLALQVERKIGVTVSIGLGANKMLAKVASELGKPRGFRIIGATDAMAVLGPMPIRTLPGVGPVMARRLEELGLHSIADLWTVKEDDLVHRFGLWARRLLRFAHGEDLRKVGGGRHKSVTIGAETTFNHDLATLDEIGAELRPLCELVARRLVKADHAAASLTLKLRRSDWLTITRAARLHDPTQRAETIWRAVQPVLAGELDGSRFRLVGVTATHLVAGRLADPPDLFQTDDRRPDTIG